MNLLLRSLECLFALGAATFWILASIERGPAKVLAGIESLGGPDFFGSHQVQITKSIIKQSRLNAWAASCAAVSAAIQGILVFLFP
jgi:hypothetical protein